MIVLSPRQLIAKLKKDWKKTSNRITLTTEWLISEFKKDWRNIPNRITLTRLAFGVVPAILLFSGLEICHIVSFWMFVFLIFTDWMDGLAARILNQRTKIGRILDPLADRVITGSVVIVLIVQNLNNRPWLSVVLMWFVVAFAIISFLIIRAIVNDIEAKPNISGKIKTILISGLIICLIGETLIFTNFIALILPYLITMTVTASLYSTFEYILYYSKVEGNPYRNGISPRTAAEDSALIIAGILAVVAIVGGITGINLIWFLNVIYLPTIGVTMFIAIVVEEVIRVITLKR